MRVPIAILTLVTAVAVVSTQGLPDDRAERLTLGTRSFAAGRNAAADNVSLQTLRSWDQRITALARTGDMRRVAAVSDGEVAGRVQERFEQRHRGVRVFGADVTRQLNAFGQAESVFGAIYPDITIDTTPRLDQTEAEAQLGVKGAVLHGRGGAELVVLPMDDGSYRLTWTARVSITDGWSNRNIGPIRRVFIDANTGATVRSYNDTWTQSAAVGSGAGVLGDQKKMMSALQSGKFLAVDLMRPPDTRNYGAFPKAAMITFDLKGNINYALTMLDTVSPSTSDIASDDDNAWGDAGLVDAHAYAGYTYDYYYKRFGRKGLDNNNIEIWSFVNPVRVSDYQTYYNRYSELFLNAAYLGDGNIYYGVGLPSTVTVDGQKWYPFSGALDVVAHELSHGVTDYTSKLIYSGEPGALNEAFSDMMGAAVENYFQPVGSGLGQADWLIGEDIARTGGIRSMSNPVSFGDPDHYSVRYTGVQDNGGVHINSGIINHMYYLAIMGGTNRVSRQTVTGVGFDNREQIERVIYRAFTQLLPAGATFTTARAATIQAARDLYGSNSAAERALTAAWSAVGVS